MVRNLWSHWLRVKGFLDRCSPLPSYRKAIMSVEKADSESISEDVVMPSTRKEKRKRSNKEAHQYKMAKRRKKREDEAEERLRQEKEETSVYYKDGLRHVRPYYHNFQSHVKGRWVGLKAGDAFKMEFRTFSNDYLRKEIETGRILDMEKHPLRCPFCRRTVLLISVNRKKCTFDTILKSGDYVESFKHRHEPPVTAQKVKIIHNDDDMVVVDKPSSIPVHPSGCYRHNCILLIVRREYGLNTIRVAHRLDRLTSGVLLLPKTYEKTRELMDAFQERQLQKTYLARVVGEFPEEPVTVDEPISLATPKYSIVSVSPDGKPSTTRFERVSCNGHSSVVKCWPKQGRMHQIRAHLRHLGHPIINDPIYNHSAWEDPAIAGADAETRIRFVLRQLLKTATNEEEADAEYDNVMRAIKQIKASSEAHQQRLAEAAERRQERNRQRAPNKAEQDTTADSGSPETLDCLSQTTASTGVTASTCTDIVEGKTRSKSDRQVHIPDKESCCLESSASSSSISAETDQPSIQSLHASTTAATAAELSLDQVHEESCASEEVAREDSGCTGTPRDDVLSGKSALSRSQEADGASQDRDKAPTEDICTDAGSPPRAVQAENIAVSSEASSTDAVGADTFDELCWKCQHPVPDPAPESLILYLHALSYESNTWKYESQWPEWANEDWVMPEYYKESGSDQRVVDRSMLE